MRVVPRRCCEVTLATEAARPDWIAGRPVRLDRGPV